MFCLIKDQKWQKISDFEQFVSTWELFMNIFFFLYIGSLWSTLMQSSSINFSYLIVLYSSRLHISQNKQLWLNEFTHLSSLLWLSAVCTHYYIGCMNILLLHTVSFDWFLSGLEWILNSEFCLLKPLIFYQKLSWNIRSRLNFSTLWVFEHLDIFYKNLHFLC